MKKLLLIGASGHAKVVADLVRNNGNYCVEGFVDTTHAARAGEPFYGARILGGQSALRQARENGIDLAFPAFGLNEARLQWVERLIAEGWQVPALIHPDASVSPSVSLGAGVAVMAGAVVQADTRLGDACIINTRASVDHDCDIGKGVHIAPACALAGHVSVGSLSMLGIGTIVRDRILIGERVQTGAGAVVVSNLPDHCLAYGVPARPVDR